MSAPLTPPAPLPVERLVARCDPASLGIETSAELPELDVARIHGRAVDADKVHAELRDGVLRVSLPKAEALKPRKISVG